MKNKIIVSLIMVMLILCCTHYSLAESNNTDAAFYYKDTELGILAYKQINAFRLSLADGSVLSDASISTNSQVDIVENLKKVQIVFVIDTSGSMSGTRVNTTRNSTKTLVNALYDKLGEENLDIGIIYFNSNMDTGKILNLTNNRTTILNHIDKIYASGGTYMSSSLARAKQMLMATGDSEDIIKIVCTLSDGSLADESQAIAEFKNINSAGISTISIFAETSITSAFANLANQNPELHKNFQTSTSNLANTIAKDIYNEIYLKIILLSDPKTVYNINNAGIIAGDDKIIFQVDEEILHGATLEIEYVISITSSFDTNHIKIKDFYSEDLIFTPNQRMITENKINSDYGWKFENGTLMTDSGGNITEAAKEHKVKLILSTVFTPTKLRDLNKIGNYVTFSLNRIENGQTTNIVIDKNNTSTEETKIKALDFLIIPPTGYYFLQKQIVWTLSASVAITSIVLIIVCIQDYSKIKRKKK